ncbi:MAG: helix-turn-helix transcriptional regulator [Chloroflexi bacterium]|nr:helix-turn-helix transcriptional regulator [Chloroflexota bacterium]
MDGLRVGRSLRAIRIQLRLRQVDVAERAHVSRSFVSKVELGLIRTSDLDRLERICRVLGAELDVRIRWRGEGLDRLLDEAHAILVDRSVGELRALGWEVAVEVTFSHFGDRGSIDIFGWHPATASILIVEVKSVIPDSQGTLMPLDRKTRLGLTIGRERSLEGKTVSKLLVVGDRTVNRRRVGRLASMFEAALPARGHAVRRWLKAPTGTLAGMLFLSDSPPGGVRRGGAGRLRVNPARRGPPRVG